MEEVSGQADVIILLSHLGLEAEQRLAQQFPEIDLIVGGKSLHVFDAPVQLDPTQAVIVHAGSLGQRLGAVRLDFDDQGRVVDKEGGVVLLLPEVPSDPAMSELIERYNHLLAPTPPPVIGDGE